MSTPDKEIVIIIDTDGVVRERSAGEATRAGTLEDILSGQLGFEIGRIDAYNPHEGNSGDITEDVAREVLGAFADTVTDESGWDRLPSFVRAQIDDEVDCRIAEWEAEGQAEADHIAGLKAAWRASRGCTPNGHVIRHLSSRRPRLSSRQSAAE